MHAACQNQNIIAAQKRQGCDNVLVLQIVSLVGLCVSGLLLSEITPGRPSKNILYGAAFRFCGKPYLVAIPEKRTFSGFFRKTEHGSGRCSVFP